MEIHGPSSTSTDHGRPRPPGRRQRPQRAALTALVVVAAVALGACTTSEGSDGSGDGDASPTTSEVPTTEAGTEATGEPVKIGYVNTDSGATAIPELTEGAEIAAERINAHGGGIGGRPIELVTCGTDGTPESSASCANEMISEGVIAVIEGADLGSDAKIPILQDAGIATLGTSTIGTGQSLNQDAFFFSPAATTYPAVEVDLAASIGAKSITLLLPDVPQVPVVSDIGAKQAELNDVQVQVVTFDPAAPDFDASLAAIMSNGSDAIATIATDDWCTGMVRAARSAGFEGDLIMGTCGRFAEELGVDETEGVYGISSVWSPRSVDFAPDEAKQVIDEYVAAMDADGKGDDIMGLSFGGYAAVQQAAWVLSTIEGELTAETVLAAMKVMKDGPNPLGQPITCDPRPQPGFSGCTTGWMFFQQQPDGQAKPVVDEFVIPKS
ncbi:MAG: ABC transporter substrate-binding protein [Actinomycetota bacterium]|nr:ABC transporter substrate-binding protein [Actinomycetota bacterium]